jgi:hypothetical protein
MDICNTLWPFPHPLNELITALKAVIKFNDIIWIFTGEAVVAVVHKTEERFLL